MKTFVLALSLALGIVAVVPIVRAQDSTVGQKVDDAAITTKVKTKLVAERPGNLVKVNVDTTDGVVRLRGTVPTLEDKRRAEELAKLTAGVKNVVNELTVQSAAADQPSTRDAPAASPATTFVGRHTMSGEVTDVDATHGRVTLRTAEGDLQLHFPPTTLQTIKRGDRLTVELGVRKE
jgi:hypothetical protein